jgi:hypothetical protein
MRTPTIFIPTLVLALAAPAASAQSTGLTHTVEGYFMGASMTGTAGAGPVTGDVNLTSSKIFENLQLGATGTGDGGRATAEVDVDEWLVEATGSYRFSPVFAAVGGGAVHVAEDRDRAPHAAGDDHVTHGSRCRRGRLVPAARLVEGCHGSRREGQ